MKKLITLAVMLMLAASASAQSNNETQQKPKGPFSFGVGYDFGYFVAENVKYDDGTNFRANWKRGIHLINLNFDYAITPRWTTGIATGFSAYGIPLLFEVKHFFGNNVNSSRWLTYANMGVNFSLPEFKVGMQAGIGGGYRFHIAPRFKIDVKAGYKFMQLQGKDVTVAATTDNAHTNGHAFTLGVGFAF